MAPSLPGLAIKGTRKSLSTLRAFGQRIPGAGTVIAHSLDDAVRDRNVKARRGLSSDRVAWRRRPRPHLRPQRSR
jgi:hypothetical protein